MKIPSIGLKKVRITLRCRIHSVGSGIDCRASGRGFDAWVDPCKGVGIPESGKFLLTESRIRGKMCLWNPESWALESGIQLKKSGLPLTIEIQSPSSTDKDLKPVAGIRNPRRGIQNPRVSFIPLHGATRSQTNIQGLKMTEKWSWARFDFNVVSRHTLPLFYLGT